MFDVLENAASDGTGLQDGQTFSDWVKGNYYVLFMIDGAGNLPNFQGLAVASSQGIEILDVARSGGIRLYVK